MKAWLGLRDGVHYRREAFAAGLEALGYTVMHDVTTRPGPGDVLVIWNRYRDNARAADAFEQRGLPVLVAENGYLGNELAGDRWYAISRNQHNGAGTWPNGGPERWDSLGIELVPMRTCAGPVVVLPQRGIGPQGVAMPQGWLAGVEVRLKAARIDYRVRFHPGVNDSIPLERDLADARAVVTWGSGAALKALALGVPVFYEFKQWIGWQAGAPVLGLLMGDQPKTNEADRLAMFRQLAWAQWRLSEIKSGEAFRWLLTRN